MADITNINDANTWNITRIAQAFGMGRDTVRRRLTTAQITPAKKIKGVPVYSLVDVGPALFANDTSVKPLHYKPEELPPKDRKDYYQSENERIKLEKAQGLLIPIDEVRKDKTILLKGIVGFFDGLPDLMERKHSWKAEELTRLVKESDSYRNILYEQLMDLTDE